MAQTTRRCEAPPALTSGRLRAVVVISQSLSCKWCVTHVIVCRKATLSPLQGGLSCNNLTLKAGYRRRSYLTDACTCS
eukprot:6334507-Amphidinium_carterae.1